MFSVVYTALAMVRMAMGESILTMGSVAAFASRAL